MLARQYAGPSGQNACVPQNTLTNSPDDKWIAKGSASMLLAQADMLSAHELAHVDSDLRGRTLCTRWIRALGIVTKG